MGETLLATTGDLEQDINRLALRVLLVSSVTLALLILAAVLTKNKVKKLRLPIFLMISFVVLVSTGTLFGSTIYLNIRSESKGPVHWHADFEIWACGAQLELRDPSGFLSNKIGTPTLHEHDDQRIHLEGVVVDKEEDATLGKFMRVVGGSISNEALTVPLTDSLFEDFVDGDAVDPDADGKLNSLIKTDVLGKRYFQATKSDKCGEEAAEPQAFVYRYDEENKTYSQRKLDHPEKYVIRDEAVVPPGDCIIVEFAPRKEHTDKLCEQYGIRDKLRCEDFTSDKANELCSIEEVNGGSE